MKSTAAIRRFDDLGRIVVPKEMRERAFGTAKTEGMPVEIYYEDDGTIILKLYEEEKKDE
jgi:bifunctional DNA-binding transcriptional regulator/antitoxin component of YhaV-PrlF toxin-antitoxin module